MTESTAYLLAADTVLLVHILFVLFVVLGLLAIFVGGFFQWTWIRNWWFRVLHLVAIAVVVLQSWLGVICPLTDMEMFFRNRAGETVYAGSFVAHWLEWLLYYRAPPWVFRLIYTLFGLTVLASWFWVRPSPRKKASI